MTKTNQCKTNFLSKDKQEYNTKLKSVEEKAAKDILQAENKAIQEIKNCERKIITSNSE
jgi:hypothetical protein